MTNSIKGLSSPQFNSVANLQLSESKQLSLGKAPDTKEKIHEAARQFESLLLHQMFSSMGENVPKDSLLGSSNEENYMKDMFNQALADSVSKGQGIGIRQVLEKDMARVDHIQDNSEAESSAAKLASEHLSTEKGLASKPTSSAKGKQI